MEDQHNLQHREQFRGGFRNDNNATSVQHEKKLRLHQPHLVHDGVTPLFILRLLSYGLSLRLILGLVARQGK